MEHTGKCLQSPDLQPGTGSRHSKSTGTSEFESRLFAVCSFWEEHIASLLYRTDTVFPRTEDLQSLEFLGCTSHNAWEVWLINELESYSSFRKLSGPLKSYPPPLVCARVGVSASGVVTVVRATVPGEEGDSEIGLSSFVVREWNQRMTPSEKPSFLNPETGGARVHEHTKFCHQHFPKACWTHRPPCTVWLWLSLQVASSLVEEPKYIGMKGSENDSKKLLGTERIPPLYPSLVLTAGPIIK